MIKLMITHVLDEDEKVQGILYGNQDSTLIYFPKTLVIWSVTLGRYYNLHTHEIFSPEGSYQISTRDQAIRLLTLIKEEQVVQETAEEMSARIKEGLNYSTTWTWVSDYFNKGEDRFLLTTLGEKAVEELLKPAGSRYAKTTKGKLTQKKWRNSPGGKETLEKRKGTRKDEKSNFKAASKWIGDHPGSSYMDWEEYCRQAEVENA